MALIAAAVVPAAPLVVPQVAGGSAALDEALRLACHAAVASLGDGPIVVVGAAPETRTYSGSHDFRGFGVPYPPDRPDLALPAPLGVGSWLLGGTAGRFVGVRADEPVADCLRLGRALVADEDVGVLICADGTACRSERAPGYFDARAAAFDDRAETALRRGEPAGLADLDASLAADLLCGGRAALQVLAGAAGGRRWRADLLYADAPYGVCYLVATWSAGTTTP